MALTDIQKKLLLAGADKRLLVEAGPGTGKTHCLVKRLEFLVDKEELIAGSQILVLSFSVAAVAEVKSRIKVAVDRDGVTDDILFTQVRTFDSFASHFIIEILGRESLTGGYEERITKATDLMANDDKAKEILQKYQHIMVDEIQDLVGARAEMTWQLLDKADCGFTILGDSAQGIYDFQIDNEKNAMTSTDFLDKVHSIFPDLDNSIVFEKNYRILGNQKLERISKKGRNLILSDRKMAAVYLFDEYQTLDSLGEISNLSLPENFSNNRSCFLCRDNGQVYRLASSLKRMNVPFRIQKRQDEKNVPSWVGWLFFGWESTNIRRQEFIKLSEDRLKNQKWDPEDLWFLLLRMTHQSKNIRILDLNLLRRALKTDAIFPEAELPQKNEIVLSTIHRSKGREFDRVAVVIGDDPEIEEAIDSEQPLVHKDAEDEMRVLFVALTRARSELYRLEAGNRYGLHSNDLDRWVEAPYRWSQHGPWRPLRGFEAGHEGDIDIHSYVSKKHYTSDEIYENQERIRNLSYGDCVTLNFNHTENWVPVYDIYVRLDDKDVSIGTTDRRFGDALCQSISGSSVKKVPHQIKDLWIRDIVTEVGDAGMKDIPRDLLSSCLWTGVRIMGIGSCSDWREM